MTSLRHLATDKLFVEGWVIHRIYDMPTEYLILKNQIKIGFFFHQMPLSAIFWCMGILRGGVKKKASSSMSLVKYSSYPDFSTGFLCIQQLIRLLHRDKNNRISVMRILICFRQNGKSVLKSLALFLIIDRQGRNEKKNPTCLANLTPANNAFLVHMPKQEKKYLKAF